MTEKRVLICDDEPAFGRFVQNVAEGMGYEVCVTTDGSAFIEEYHRFKPTTVVLDMVMPGMDGNEIINWLAEQQSTSELIILTGYTPDYATNASTLAEFKGLKPLATLRKPIDINQLRAVLSA